MPTFYLSEQSVLLFHTTDMVINFRRDSYPALPASLHCQCVQTVQQHKYIVPPPLTWRPGCGGQQLNKVSWMKNSCTVYSWVNCNLSCTFIATSKRHRQSFPRLRLPDTHLPAVSATVGNLHSGEADPQSCTCGVIGGKIWSGILAHNRGELHRRRD